MSFNIAFEISPLLAASGVFGDKSGVYRYTYELIDNLSQYLLERNIKVKIFLFTLNPHLLSTPNLDVYSLLNKRNIELIRVDNFNIKTIEDYSEISPVLKVPVKIILGKKLINKYIEKKNFTNYINLLRQQFKHKKVALIHHSETGFCYFGSNFRNVITVHDMIALKYPELQRSETVSLHKRKTKFIKQHADGVICVSKNTKKDLEQTVKFRKGTKVKVIYETVNVDPNLLVKEKLDSHFEQLISFIRKEKKQILQSKKYFLHVGTFEPRKNLLMLVRAFLDLYEEGEVPRDFKLVLVGGKGWGNVYEKIENYIYEKYLHIRYSPIIMLNFLADEYIFSLYSNAYAFIYPSLYEGFGLPILEAFLFDIPVIASRVASIPEVGGKAALYINPYDINSIKSKMIFLLKNSGLRKQIVSNIRKQSKKFSLTKMVKETFDFYRLLIGH